MPGFIRIASILAIVASATPTLADDTMATQQPELIVEKVQAFYRDISRVTALFRQSVTYDTFGSTKVSEGALWLHKPGKMRWDYRARKNNLVVVKRSFISNGEYLYVVDHENKQVVKKALHNDLLPVAVSFLYGRGDLASEFTPSVDTTAKYGSRQDLVLRLVPKKPSAQYKVLILVVSSDDFHVTQSIIIDSSNNANHFRFFAPDFKKEVKATWFDFSEKSLPDYRMVDADRKPSR